MQWLLLTLIVVGWILVTVIKYLFELYERRQERESHKRIALEQFPDRAISFKNNESVSSAVLYERNKDIIEKHLNAVTSGSHRSYYADDATRDCVNDICLAEGQIDIRPQHQYFRNWKQGAPQNWVELAEEIRGKISSRIKELEDIKSAERELETKKQMTDLMEKHQGLLDQFNEIAYRKVTTIDDYGEENWEALDKEIYILLSKIGKKEGKTEEEIKDWKKSEWRIRLHAPEYFLLREELGSSFRNYYSSRKNNSSNGSDFSNMSGIEFENHIADLLKKNGFTNIMGTPKTGDQGADLLARKGGKKIVIQAKRHASAVGNKAVQEVIGAIRFYDVHEGWVITNSVFTKSAKELANKNNVKLIDGADLERFSSIV
jgi:hypothetical protein